MIRHKLCALLLLGTSITVSANNLTRMATAGLISSVMGYVYSASKHQSLPSKTYELALKISVDQLGHNDRKILLNTLQSCANQSATPELKRLVELLQAKKLTAEQSEQLFREVKAAAQQSTRYATFARLAGYGAIGSLALLGIGAISS